MIFVLIFSFNIMILLTIVYKVNVGDTFITSLISFFNGSAILASLEQFIIFLNLKTIKSECFSPRSSVGYLLFI